jgi:hypothetical protein
MKVTNTSRMIQEFNIPCATRPCDGSGCLCSEVVARRPHVAADGTVGILEERKRIPGSVTILAGATVEIPDWAAESPDVQAAVARRAVRLVR